ncbi:MAG: ornithine carbamoyltransferase [Nitrospirota bacterium]|nr:ornithine carbamoyltransferase [Nitrospirota bacterium]
MTRHLLDLACLGPRGLADLLLLAEEVKTHPREARYADALKGRTLGMLFHKASTRTRISFEVAMNQLGGSALLISTKDSQLGRGESVADTARTLSRYLDGLMIRTFEDERLAEWAEHATIPIINGLTDLHHPCQAVAYLLTVKERFGTVQGVSMAYVGDGNNVAHSLMEAAALSGMDLRVATPQGYEPDAEVSRRVRELCAEGGGRVTVTTDPKAAVDGVRAVYTDVWASMGQEEEKARRERDFAGFQVDDTLLAGAAGDAIFMHCLPAYRGLEVSAGVMDGLRSAVFDQAENRLHAQKAVLLTLLVGG